MKKSVYKSINTPIVDFVGQYAALSPVRLHMPGHKGETENGAKDVTEIFGADELFAPKGIIAESEKNAGAIFGADTFYSTEGSSLCIRAMTRLFYLYAVKTGKRPLVLAARNAHKSFISAAALSRVDVEWLYPESGSLFDCRISAKSLAFALDNAKNRPIAVYITSPDYLGNVADVSALSAVCHERGVLLAVDNAHGAYLKFLSPSLHPIDLGADVACDSAHKTLPALTGTAYLHLNKTLPDFFGKNAKDALAFFASTSPSYLLLESLDELNATLSDGYGQRLSDCAKKVAGLKAALRSLGLVVVGDEPIKLTVAPKSYGYTGKEIADILRGKGIFCEFSDDDYLVAMFSPYNRDDDYAATLSAFCAIPRREPIAVFPPALLPAKRVLTIADALYRDSEEISVDRAIGEVFADCALSCPPAVPIVVAGEEIGESERALLAYYGIDKIKIIKR